MNKNSYFKFQHHCDGYYFEAVIKKVLVDDEEAYQITSWAVHVDDLDFRPDLPSTIVKGSLLDALEYCNENMG